MKTKFNIHKENYGYTIQPASFKLRGKLEKHLKEMGVYPSASFFFQSLGR